MVHSKLFGRPSRGVSGISKEEVNTLINIAIERFSKNVLFSNDDIDLKNRHIVKNLKDPIDDKHAVNKSYVDAKFEKGEEHILKPSPLNLKDDKTNSIVKIKKIYGTFYRIYGSVKVQQKTPNNYRLCVIPSSYNGKTLEDTDRQIFISDHKCDICLKFRVENNQYTLYIEEELDKDSEFNFEFYALL